VADASGAKAVTDRARSKEIEIVRFIEMLTFPLSTGGFGLELA
jgi:hypothetical protein